MNTIHLESSQVPPQLRGTYTGRKLKAQVTESVTVPIDAGLWDGGSRDTYRLMRIADGAEMPASQDMAAPWDPTRRERTIPLQPGFCVVRHSIFCGTDAGLTFYVHPADATRLLPAPVEMTEHEKIVLNATASFKASYGGRDRYEMAREQDYVRPNVSRMIAPFPTRAQWNEAKAALISRGLLNKAGAITTAGRNARSAL